MHGGGDACRSREPYDGGPGEDDVRGGQGDDELKGGAGKDFMMGFGGDDTFEGEGGGDDIRGGADDDTLNGGDGIDRLEGDADDDTLNGDRGADKLWAISSPARATTSLNGTAAVDTVSTADRHQHDRRLQQPVVGAGRHPDEHPLEHLLDHPQPAGIADEVGAELSGARTAEGHVVAQDRQLAPSVILDRRKRLV